MLNVDRTYLWPGVPMALASAILFGVTTPFSKLLLGEVGPQLLAGLLYLGAGLGLAIGHLWYAAAGSRATEAPLRRSDIPWLAAVILFGGILGPLLLMLGLVRTDAASAALLLNLEGLATMSIAWLVFRENVDRRLFLGALAILLGAALLSWKGHGFVLDQGALLIAGACIAWGIDNNLTRKLSSADPVLIAMTKGLVAGSVNVALGFLQGAALPSVNVVIEAAAIGFFGIGVSLVLFVFALRYLGTARTGAYFSLAPFIGALVAVVLLHDRLTIKLVFSGALMGFGLWMHLAERHEHEHQHEALEHEHSHFHDEHHRHKHDAPITEPHSHWHRHEPMRHTHPHYPDLHHRHAHAHATGFSSASAITNSLRLRDLNAGLVATARQLFAIVRSRPIIAWTVSAALFAASLGAIVIAYAPRIKFAFQQQLAPPQLEKKDVAPRGDIAPAPPIASTSPKEADSRIIGQHGSTEVGEEKTYGTSRPPGDYLKKILPNGVELNILRTGVEAKLLAFLEGTKPAIKIASFELDRVSFNASGNTPQSSSLKQLQIIAKILSGYPKSKVIIVGHSDNRGSRDANKRISRVRADSVLRELTQMGVDASLLSVKGFGGDRPVAPNNTEAGRARNRRISLEVVRK